jgi:hypothetical protein
MGKSMELLRSSRCANGGRERRALVYFHLSEPLGKKREPLWKIGKGINTPLSPNGHLSAAIPH